MTKALMKLAVKDAKAKAKVLAENAGVALGNVVHISYTDSYNSIALSPVEEMCADGMYKAKTAGPPKSSRQFFIIRKIRLLPAPPWCRSRNTG